MYRVGSKANAVSELNYIDPVEFRLHPDMHMPSACRRWSRLQRTATPQITVSWMAPADNGGAAVTGYVLQRAYKDADDMMTDFMTIAATDAATWWNTLDCSMMNDAVPADSTPAPGDDDSSSPYCKMYDGLADDAKMVVDATFAADYGTITDTSYMDMGLMPDATYYYRVRAMNAAGYGYWSAEAMAMTEAAAGTTLGDAMGLMMVETDTDPGTIELTWTAGANANVYRVAGARRNDDGSFDLTDQVWELVEGDMQNSFTVDGNALNLSPGTYLFAVIAGQRDDSGQTTWGSTWAILDDVDYQQ